MMKYFLLALLVTPLYSYGQFQKGDKFIGGTSQFNTQGTMNPDQGSSTYRSTSFYIYPRIAFLVDEKFAIGGQVGYSNTKTINNAGQPSEQKYTSSGLSVGLLSRRYFTISEKFAFAITGQIDFSRWKETQTTNSYYNKAKISSLGISLVPNLIFFPTPKWGLEASMGSLSYGYSKGQGNDAGRNNFNFFYGTLNFGLSYYL